MWYALIFGGILAVFYCYRVSKSRRRPRGFAKALASQTATILAACVVLGIVCAMVHLSNARGGAAKSERLASELGYKRALGAVLARETLAKAERARGVLIVAPKPTDAVWESYLEAIGAGVREVVKDLPVAEAYLEIELADSEAPGDSEVDSVVASERSLEARRRITITELESVARKHPENNVLICLSNLPLDYAGSGFAARVRKGDLAIGFALNDVFTLGDEIATKQVSVCALPQRAMGYPVGPVPAEAMEAFNQRYHLLTEGNVERFALKNRRMMHIQRID